MPEERMMGRGEVRWLAFQAFTDERLMHGFSLRHGGVSRHPYNTLNQGLHVGDDSGAVLENRNRLAHAMGFRPPDAVYCRQVHGTRIARVTAAMRGRGHTDTYDALPDTDGLICSEEGVVLVAHAADCLILFFYEPDCRCIGLAHAGWRGAVAGMGRSMVDALAGLGTAREKLRVAVSPGIGACCYRVGAEMADAVPASLHDIVFTERESGLFFDLPRFQRLQLLEAGIREENISASRFCTNCNSDLFFSYRNAQGVTGRMAGVIALK